MNYVETLRARKVLPFTAIVCLVVLVLAVFVRGSIHLPMAIKGISYLELAPAVAALFASFVAVNLGSVLARENDGHLEVVWSKPVSRVQYALRLFAVDARALTAIYCMILVSVLLIGATLGANLALSTPFVYPIAISLLLPLAFYAIALAASASLRQHGESAAALVWPVAVVLQVFNGLQLPSILHGITWVVNLVNPFVYFGKLTVNGIVLFTSPFGPPITSVVALLALIVLATYSALVQWQHLEIT